jgi:hypothetical protein
MEYYRDISKCKGHKCNFTRAASRAYKYVKSNPVLFTLTGHSLLRHACTFTFLQAEGIFAICCHFYNNKNRKELIITFEYLFIYVIYHTLYESLFHYLLYL